MAAKIQCLLFAIFHSILALSCLCAFAYAITLSGVPFPLFHLPKFNPPLKAQVKPHFLRVIAPDASSWKPSHPAQDPLFFALLIYFLAVFCFTFLKSEFKSSQGQKLYFTCLVLL